MATKTITLEIDAYEKLRSSKLAGESFSEVVRRADIADEPLTCASLRNYLKKGGAGVNEKHLKRVKKVARHDPIPDNPWA